MEILSVNIQCGSKMDKSQMQNVLHVVPVGKLKRKKKKNIE